MARKTTVDRLKQAVADILNEYAADVQGNVVECSRQMAKKGAQALRRESKAKFPKGTGEYAKGWKVETTGKAHEQTTFSSEIYNEHAGMPHLLEHGHLTRNGTGRTDFPDTPPREHIAPIEHELVEAFEREVMSKL